MKSSILLFLFVPATAVAQQIQESALVDASLADFPNLHPIVVHVPIMLLMVAALTQIGSLFVWKKPLDWVTLLLLLGGVAGAIAASEWTHPHTTGLTEAASQVLAHHDTYAAWTLWLGVGALVLKGVSIWLLRGRRWLEWVIALVVTGSAVAVGLTGHYGGTLVYIHGVGVQGNFVEGESDHDADGHTH